MLHTQLYGFNAIFKPGAPAAVSYNHFRPRVYVCVCVCVCVRPRGHKLLVA